MLMGKYPEEPAAIAFSCSEVFRNVGLQKAAWFILGLLLVQEVTPHHLISKGINTYLKKVTCFSCERQLQTSTPLMAESCLLIPYVNIFLVQLTLCFGIISSI